jgi:hypothetical protein
MNFLLTNWKTTVQSLLTVIIGLSGISIPAGALSVKQALWWAVVGSAAKVLLGLFQKDAGSVLAVTPANPTPHLESSSETPDNPAAQVVKKEP